MEIACHLNKVKKLSFLLPPVPLLGGVRGGFCPLPSKH